MPGAHSTAQQLHCIGKLLFKAGKPPLPFVLRDQKRQRSSTNGYDQSESKSQICNERPNECKQGDDYRNENELHDLHLDGGLLEEKLDMQNDGNFNENPVQ